MIGPCVAIFLPPSPFDASRSRGHGEGRVAAQAAPICPKKNMERWKCLWNSGFSITSTGTTAAQGLLRGPAEADRGLRPRRHLRLSLRRASFDAARHGAVAERLSLGRRAAHQAAAVRAAGLHAGALPSAAARRRNLHARPDEPRPVPARHRQGHLADRARLLRRRLQERRQDVRRVARHRPAGADHQARRLRGRVLQLQECAVRGRVLPEAASAAVVRRGQSGQRRARRQGRHELHQQLDRGRGQGQGRALQRDLSAQAGGERRSSA